MWSPNFRVGWYTGNYQSNRWNFASSYDYDINQIRKDHLIEYWERLSEDAAYELINDYTREDYNDTLQTITDYLFKIKDYRDCSDAVWNKDCTKIIGRKRTTRSNPNYKDDIVLGTFQFEKLKQYQSAWNDYAPATLRILIEAGYHDGYRIWIDDSEINHELSKNNTTLAYSKIKQIEAVLDKVLPN